MICTECECEYDIKTRRGKPGRLTMCSECADQEGDIQPYTGNMIYSHKTGSSIQINADPRLTNYISNATKLKNKGSNMGDNLRASSKMNPRTKGACVSTADAFNYKNKDDK